MFVVFATLMHQFAKISCFLFNPEKTTGHTYFYEMRHRPSTSKRPAFIGADHGDDLVVFQGAQYTGKVGTASVTLTEEDIKTADVVMKAWTNFACTG